MIETSSANENGASLYWDLHSGLIFKATREFLTFGFEQYIEDAVAIAYDYDIIGHEPVKDYVSLYVDEWQVDKPSLAASGKDVVFSDQVNTAFLDFFDKPVKLYGIDVIPFRITH